MGAFDDLRRGFRAGLRGNSAARQNGGGFAFGGDLDHEEPHGFGGDELGECKAVIAGLLAQTASLNEQLAQWAAAVAERDKYITELADERDRACATRDRYQETGKRAAAQLDALETIIAFPGVKNALLKSLHPDTGTGGDVPSRTAVFQTLMTVLARLGFGR